MVVDDSRMVRRIAREILTGLGYSVVEAEHGGEALDRVRAHGLPDLILLDWNMPVMSGLETLKELRKVMPELPTVMFCTTNSDAVDIHAGIDAGATDWIVKPFDADAMQAKLEKIGAL